jgi:F-type H+-transporting ATPase subunit epsilon
MLIAKGAGGELGILPGHAPLSNFTPTGSDSCSVGKWYRRSIYVSGGVLEVQPHVVTVLADTADPRPRSERSANSGSA